MTIGFVILFYILQAFGPVPDDAFSNWTGILAPFGAVMRFLAPGTEDALLAFIEALLITGGTVIKKN
ncbi:MAG: hypothetical protein K0A89_10785 [ANME-2 cluster archaeon]|nr:hypothetical protein [ANME-2 cluster archaeon]